MKNYLAFVLVIFSLSSFAQADATSILDKVSSKTKSYPSINASFNFTMKNSDADLNETNKGTIIIQDAMYRLSMNGVEIYNNGKSQWTYTEDAGEVYISDAEESEESAMNPANIFSMYKNGFTHKLVGSSEINGKATHTVELTPTEEKEFSKVILQIDKSTDQIISAEMNGNDGNIYQVLITKFDTTKKYEANNFVFDSSKHPNVEVVDMR